MVQITLSVAFVLAAAAIAPAVALPYPLYREGSEGGIHLHYHKHQNNHAAGNLGPDGDNNGERAMNAGQHIGLAHGHPRSGHPRSGRPHGAPPALSLREYVDEVEARGEQEPAQLPPSHPLVPGPSNHKNVPSPPGPSRLIPEPSVPGPSAAGPFGPSGPSALTWPSGPSAPTGPSVSLHPTGPSVSLHPTGPEVPVKPLHPRKGRNPRKVAPRTRRQSHPQKGGKRRSVVFHKKVNGRDSVDHGKVSKGKVPGAKAHQTHVKRRASTKPAHPEPAPHVPREYAGDYDLFERSFDDLEFDARDFEDLDLD